MQPLRMQSRSSMMTGCFYLIGLPVLLLGNVGPFVCSAEIRDRRPDPQLVTMVENDWHKQEARLGRSCDSVEAIKGALHRIESFLKKSEEGDLFSTEVRRSAAAKLRSYWERAALASVLSPDERIKLYREIRWFGRDLVLSNPLFAERPIVFLKTRRFICQMLHEYIAYFYSAADLHGGGVCVLKEPGFSLEIEDLTTGKFARGIFQSLLCPTMPALRFLPLPQFLPGIVVGPFGLIGAFLQPGHFRRNSHSIRQTAPASIFSRSI
jgi:hypothetical protein